MRIVKLMIYATVAVAVLIVVIYVVVRRASSQMPGRYEHDRCSEPTPRPAPDQLGRERPGLAASARPSGRLSAAEMLSRAQQLRQANPHWVQIFSGLNPNDDAETAGLLLRVRDSHAFAEKVLDLIATGCRRALDQSPTADGLEGLRQALRGPDPKPAVPPEARLPPLFDGENALIDDIYLVFRDLERYTDINRVARAVTAKEQLVKKSVDPDEFLRRFRAKTGDRNVTEMLEQLWKR